jgi:Mn2+/Fe2+ NRAMP family transporter
MFILFVSIISFGYLYEVFITKPDPSAILKKEKNHSFVPLSILVYSQVILSLMIPLPMIPLVLLTRNKGVMGEFVNRNITTIVALVFVGIILSFNSYLIATTIKP